MGHLIFTLDFHEFVRGILTPGKESRINYDPLRLASGKEGYVYGSPEFNFTAYFEFKPEGFLEIPLISETGILQNEVIKENGRGSMLTSDFLIPDSCEEISVWISLQDNNGEVSFDSDFGKNYHFRITSQDIEILGAEIVNLKDGVGQLTVKVKACADVDRIVVRYRITNGKEPYTEIPVELFKTNLKGKTIWTTGDELIPYGSVVAYDLKYFVAGKEYKSDNNGNYYIAETKIK